MTDKVHPKPTYASATMHNHRAMSGQGQFACHRPKVAEVHIVQWNITIRPCVVQQVNHLRTKKKFVSIVTTNCISVPLTSKL